MKKVYSGRKYITWKRSSSLKTLRSKPTREFQNLKYRLGLAIHQRWENYIPVPVPSDFRFIERTKEALGFFRVIRDKEHYYYSNGNYGIDLDLKSINRIDYTSISVLKSILTDLKIQQIYLQGNAPENRTIHNYIADSGFYDGLLNMSNQELKIKGNTDRVMFTGGSGTLSRDEDAEVLKILKKIRRHLTNQDGYCPQLRTIILEICGNSIEHSESFNKKWMFGVKYEKDKVLITLVDSGRGIMKTLYRKLGRKFLDFVGKTNLEILHGAFDKKYESRTLDQNRNKGLPVIKKRFAEGYIKNLVIITNNVMIDFRNDSNSQIFRSGLGFDGTIFTLELDKTCFKNANNNKIEHSG